MNLVGYAFKPVLNTSRFEVIKSEFSNRESVLTEQVKSAEGEKYDINEQIKKLDNVNVRYAKEFPRLKSSVDALDDQIKVLNKHLAEVRQERLGMVQISKLTPSFQLTLDNSRNGPKLAKFINLIPETSNELISCWLLRSNLIRSSR